VEFERIQIGAGLKIISAVEFVLSAENITSVLSTNFAGLLSAAVLPPSLLASARQAVAKCAA
jgi:hypothetical protein